MSERKVRVALFFGGRSSEHGISCATAGGVLGAIDRTRYEVIPVGITPPAQSQEFAKVVENLTGDVRLTLTGRPDVIVRP